MNENKSINSLKKQLVAAVAMVLVAAVALGSSTYAWFAANNSVTATGMTVTAQAEAGIVISNSTKTSYGTTAATAQATDKKLIPVSTADGSTWYHATSSLFDDADASQASTKYTNAGSDGTDYVKNTFYIKSASDTAYAGNLEITKVEAVSGGTQELSKALRVGVMVGSNFYIYAPVTGYTATYKVGDGTSGISVSPKASTTATVDTSVISFPANTADGLQVDVYMWYEGEDAACKSSNIVSSLEANNVTITFTAKPTT